MAVCSQRSYGSLILIMYKCLSIYEWLGAMAIYSGSILSSHIVIHFSSIIGIATGNNYAFAVSSLARSTTTCLEILTAGAKSTISLLHRNKGPVQRSESLHLEVKK